MNIEEQVEQYLQEVSSKGEVQYIELPEQDFIQLLNHYGSQEKDKQKINFASIRGTFEIRSTQEKSWSTVYKSKAISK